MLLKRIIEEYQLYEGLDVTHEVAQSISILSRWWNLGGKVEFEKDGYIIKMIVREPIDKRDFDNILKWVNNLGYFPAHIATKIASEKYNYDDAVNGCLNGNFAIYFDPKFDIEIADDELPNHIYHITPTTNEEKILKIGLVPKSKNKLSLHPERIYFAKSVESVMFLLDNHPFVKEVKQFTIFEIDLERLNKVRKIRWFLDPIYAKSGFYAYENIPKEYLEIYRRI